MSSKTDFSGMQKLKVEEIEKILQQYLPKQQGYQKLIMEVMTYSLLAGGKRLRPMLMQETYRLFDGDSKAIHPFMAAIEMIHTYSLVHDDLPTMDNDEYRRGKKTTWKVYGEDMAILAGDGLLNFAYETAAKALETAKNEDELRRAAKALKILASKPGAYGMLGGQVVDVLESGHAVSKETLDFIYEMKTSALIECAMMIGAVLAGADESSVDDMEKIAKYTGIAFQIQDDILDVTSSLEVLGKQTHSDEKNDKTTYVTLFGIDGAKAYVQKLTDAALELLRAQEGESEFLEALLLWLIHREK